jgi:pimeloyl-ACP methyl ester carboxylesterase
VVVRIGSLSACRAVMQRRVERETRITDPNGIDSLEPVVLGGLTQWILIRGTLSSNPVLLFLHGGPGSAHILSARHFDGELVKSFVVVHRDQRGAGKSYSRRIPGETMNREQFVSDVREFSQMLEQRFNSGRIYLVGHSWGSEIGILAASRYPDCNREGACPRCGMEIRKTTLAGRNSCLYPSCRRNLGCLANHGCS